MKVCFFDFLEFSKKIKLNFLKKITFIFNSQIPCKMNIKLFLMDITIKIKKNSLKIKILL